MRVCNDYCDQIGGPLRPGWGLIFHGGEPDDRVKLLPGPIVIVSLNHDRDNANWIDHPRVIANLTVGIPDDEHGVLQPDVLVALVEATISFLERGINVLIHCAAGISRSAYLICALLMRVWNLNYDEVLAYLRQQRPKADPNKHFALQLQLLEKRLSRK